MRRLRRNSLIRDLVAETHILPENLIMPYFVIEGRNKKEPINSLPGISRLSIDNLTKDIEEAARLGIKGALLFGVTHKKDNLGTEAYAKDGILQKAIRAIKKNVKDVIVISDVCLCAYTSHGHCGIIKTKDEKRRTKDEIIVDRVETLKILARIALSHAEAGADLVAPSAMMDGQVKAIRGALDKYGFLDTGILAYSAKYASNFYGPFREALGSSPKFGDRKSYQMDFRNSDEALREIKEDINEGADIVMLKPALAYLDIIYRAKESFDIPLAAFNVSGEYAMVKNYGGGKDLVLEILASMKRAGADLIISYHSKEAAKWLR